MLFFVVVITLVSKSQRSHSLHSAYSLIWETDIYQTFIQTKIKCNYGKFYTCICCYKSLKYGYFDPVKEVFLSVSLDAENNIGVTSRNGGYIIF